MKKLFAIVVAAMLVMALSVTAFAATASLDVSAATATQADIAAIGFDLPAGLTLETGDVVTVYIKGAATNDAVRIYFTDPVDNGRVCEVVSIPVVDGVFEGTFDIAIDTTGAIQGSATPTTFLLKGPSWGVNLTEVSVEVIELTSDKIGAAEAPAEEEAPVEEAPAEEAPAEEPAVEAPAEESEPADTGLVLAVVPMLVAAAAVVISKRR